MVKHVGSRAACLADRLSMFVVGSEPTKHIKWSNTKMVIHTEWSNTPNDTPSDQTHQMVKRTRWSNTLSGQTRPGRLVVGSRRTEGVELTKS